MNVVAPAKSPVFYVHKLRLEARDGARVEIVPTLPMTSRSQGGWIVTKVVCAALAAAAVLAIAVSA